MVEKKKEYGILAMRQSVALGVYIYIPKLVISGTLEEKDGKTIFIDSTGSHYPLATEFYSTSESQLVILTVENLQFPKAQNLTSVEICLKLQEQAYRRLYLGFHDYETKNVKICSYSLFHIDDELEKSLREMNRGEDREKDFLGSALEEFDGDDLIPITKEELKKIVHLPNLEAIQKRLTELIDENESLTAHFLESEEGNDTFEPLDMEDLTGDRILEYFDKTCIAVRNERTLLGIEKIIQYFTEALKDIIAILATWETEEKDIDIACEYGFSLIDELHLILSSNRMEYIRNDLLNIQRTERINIKQLANVYDKYDRILKEEERKKTKEKEAMPKVVLPQGKIQAKEMKAFLDRFVIGQEEAKRMVISALVMNQLSESPEDRTSCLLVGPTGSGKTLIAETVSKYLDIPIEIVDITQITVPGYVGGNLEDGLSRLLMKANGNLEKAEEGVIVFDEIDKKGTEKNDDVSGRGVLHTLLPFIQGTTYNVKYNNKVVPFYTGKLTVFATGAFTEVANQKRKKGSGQGYHKTTIGFNTSLESPKKEDIVYPILTPEDFVTYGNMPDEIMGRFTTIAQLQGQTKESLKRILIEAENSPLLSEKKKLEKLGITLGWTEGYLDAVVEEALKRATGARSLKSTIEKSILDARWEAITNLGTYCSIILTEKTVVDSLDCELIDQEAVSHHLKDLLESTSTASMKVKEKVKNIGGILKK